MPASSLKIYRTHVQPYTKTICQFIKHIRLKHCIRKIIRVECTNKLTSASFMQNNIYIYIYIFQDK